jgi:hypothetical protein
MPNQLKTLLEQLKQLPIVSPKYCDNCGHQHQEIDYNFVGYQEGMFIFQVGCRNCGVSYMLRISPSGAGLAAQRLELLNVDIQPQELSKFAGKPKVNKEEAVEVFLDMENVTTLEDFLSLFSDEEDGSI